MAALPPIIAFLTADITGLKVGLDEAKAKMAETEAAGSGMGSKISMGLGAVGLAAAAAGVASVKMAGDFQQGMTTLITGAGESQANIAMVSDGILKLAVDTGTSTKQLTDGMYMIESASFHGAAGLDVLTAAAKGAKVGNADLGAVANAVTSGLNAYGLTGDHAAQVTNTLIATVANGKMHMQDLADSLGHVVPTASTAGVSLQEVGAAMSTMTMMGVPADQAATFLRQTIISLEAPSAKATKALTEIGMGSYDLTSELKKPDGLIQAIAEINAHLDTKFPASAAIAKAEFAKVTAGVETQDQALANLANNGGAGYINALKDIAGGSKTMQGLLDLTGTHLGQLQNNYDAITDAVKKGGNAITGWDLVQQDFNQKMDVLGAVFETTAIRLGTNLLPKLSEAADWFANMLPQAIAATQHWFEAHQQQIQSLGDTIQNVLVFAFHALVDVINVAVPILQFLGDHMWIVEAAVAALVTRMLILKAIELATWVAGIGQDMAEFAAFMTNPVTAIALVGIAIAGLITDAGGMRTSLKNAIWGQDAQQAYTEASTKIGALASQLSGDVVKGGAAAQAAMKQVLDAVSAAASASQDLVGQAVVQAINSGQLFAAQQKMIVQGGMQAVAGFYQMADQLAASTDQKYRALSQGFVDMGTQANVQIASSAVTSAKEGLLSYQGAQAEIINSLYVSVAQHKKGYADIQASWLNLMQVEQNSLAATTSADITHLQDMQAVWHATAAKNAADHGLIGQAATDAANKYTDAMTSGFLKEHPEAQKSLDLLNQISSATGMSLQEVIDKGPAWIQTFIDAHGAIGGIPGALNDSTTAALALSDALSKIPHDIFTFVHIDTGPLNNLMGPHAKGGPVMTGMPFTAGELGKELFLPAMATGGVISGPSLLSGPGTFVAGMPGVVIPADQTAAMLTATKGFPTAGIGSASGGDITNLSSSMNQLLMLLSEQSATGNAQTKATNALLAQGLGGVQAQLAAGDIPSHDLASSMLSRTNALINLTTDAMKAGGNASQQELAAAALLNTQVVSVKTATDAAQLAQATAQALALQQQHTMASANAVHHAGSATHHKMMAHHVPTHTTHLGNIVGATAGANAKLSGTLSTVVGNTVPVHITGTSVTLPVSISGGLAGLLSGSGGGSLSRPPGPPVSPLASPTQNELGPITSLWGALGMTPPPYMSPSPNEGLLGLSGGLVGMALGTPLPPSPVPTYKGAPAPWAVSAPTPVNVTLNQPITLQGTPESLLAQVQTAIGQNNHQLIAALRAGTG